MSKKSICWGILILLLSSTVVTAGKFDDDEDIQEAGSGAEAAVVENSVKTWKHTMSVSLRNGNPVSPDNKIQVDTDSKIETGVNGKDYWKVDDTISFSFHLPYSASVRVKCALNDDCTGKAIIQWNGQALRDENGKRKKFTFDGYDDTFEIPDLKTNRTENTLTFVCTDGEIGLESLTISADIEYPSFNINGMVIQMTSPRPGVPLDGKPVSIRWEVTHGMADGGWVKVSYRTPTDKDWQVVPGLQGVSYGSKKWGNFTWENPPKGTTCEFKIEYTRGVNPVEVAEAEEEAKQKAITEATKDLIQAKKGFLDDVDGLLPASFWTKYLDNLRSNRQTMKARLKSSLKDENNLDLPEVVRNIDTLEQIYFTAFERMMKVALSIEDEKERKDIQTKVDDFEEKVSQEFSNALENYGKDEDTKELIPAMFPKERFEQFKTAKNEFDKALRTPVPPKGPIVDLIKAKLDQFDTANKSIPYSFSSQNFSTSRSSILKLRAEVENALKDSERLNIEKAVQNIEEIDRLYTNMFKILLEKAPEFENKEDRSQVLENVENYLVYSTRLQQNVNAQFDKQESVKELLPRMFPEYRLNSIQEAKRAFSDKLAEIDRREAGYEMGRRYRNPIKKVLSLTDSKDGKVSMTSLIFTSKNDVIISYRLTRDNQPGCVHITTSLKNPEMYGSSAMMSEDPNSRFGSLAEGVPYRYENGSYRWTEYDYEIKEKPVVSPDQRYVFVKNKNEDGTGTGQVDDLIKKVCLPIPYAEDFNNVRFDNNSNLYYESGSFLNKHNLSEENPVIIHRLGNVLAYSITDDGRYLVYITKDYKGYIKDIDDNSIMEINSGNPLKNDPRHVYIRNNIAFFTGSGYLQAYTLSGKKVGEFAIDSNEITAISPDESVVLCNGKILEIHTGVTLYEVMENSRFIKWNGEGLYLWSDKETKLVHYVFN